MRLSSTQFPYKKRIKKVFFSQLNKTSSGVYKVTNLMNNSRKVQSNECVYTVQSPIRYPWPRSLKEARHVLTRRPLWHPTASWVDLSQKMNIVLNNTALCLTHISFEKNNLIIIAIICTFIVNIFFVFPAHSLKKKRWRNKGRSGSCHKILVTLFPSARKSTPRLFDPSLTFGVKKLSIQG